MYRTLVVPLDGSPFAEHAIAVASSIAQASGARVELVCVHRTYTVDMGEGSHWDAVTRRDETEYLARTAASTAARWGTDTATAVLDGSIAEAICEHAQESAAPLIVLSTHGRTGFSRVWLGSTADAVVRHAAAPVLLLRCTEEEAVSHDGLEIHEIVIALDGSGFAEQVIPHALSLAEAANAHVLLLRVVEPVIVPVPDFAPSYASAAATMNDTTQVLVERAEQYASDLAARLRREHDALEIHGAVRVSPSPASAIIEYAAERHAGVIALATHGRGVTRLLLGSVADKVLRGGRGAVLLVRPHHD